MANMKFELIYLLVFVASTNMSLKFAAIDGRITHSTIVVLHVHFDSDATLLTALRTLLHLFPQHQVLLGS